MEEFKLTRRDFLNVTAFGALSATLMPMLGCGSSHSASTRAVKVLGLVDVGQALADESLEGNHYWMDNNKKNGSVNQGSSSLVTKVSAGDSILWMLGALEVETVASLAGVIPVRSGFFDVVTDFHSVSLGDLGNTLLWEGGIAPGASGLYEYSLDILVENKRMVSLPTMALLVN